MTTFYLDDFPLDDPQGRWRLTTDTELPSLSLSEHKLVTVPFMAGAARVRGAAPTRPITLGMWIPNRPGGPTHDHVLATAQLLGLALANAEHLVLAPNVDDRRQAKILNASASEISMNRTRTGATLAFSLDLEPFWASQAAFISAQIQATTQITIPNFAGVTGPARDAVIRLSGPLTAARLTDPTTGQWIHAATSVSRGTYLYISPSTTSFWTSTSTSQWTPPAQAKIAEYGPDGPPEFWPTATTTGTELIIQTALTNASSTQLVVRGHKWYL